VSARSWPAARLGKTRRDVSAEQVLFALVVKGAQDPSSAKPATSTCFELDEEDEPVPRDENDNMTSNEQQMAKSKPVLAASLYDDPAAAA